VFKTQVETLQNHVPLEKPAQIIKTPEKKKVPEVKAKVTPKSNSFTNPYVQSEPRVEAVVKNLTI
jgi:hypothetical protein